MTSTVKPRRHYSPAIAHMIDGWDGDDPFGSAMSMAWAVAEVARAADAEASATIDGALSISWGAAPVLDLTEAADLDSREDPGDVSFETHALAAAYLDGAVTVADLTFAARVLSRYIDLCTAAGLDY